MAHVTLLGTKFKSRVGPWRGGWLVFPSGKMHIEFSRMIMREIEISLTDNKKKSNQTKYTANRRQE